MVKDFPPDAGIIVDALAEAIGREPSWPSGVVGECDRCGDATILRASEYDYLDVPTEFTCRACVEGSDDDE